MDHVRDLGRSVLLASSDGLELFKQLLLTEDIGVYRVYHFLEFGLSESYDTVVCT